MTAFVPVYNAEFEGREGGEARAIRDTLKENGVRVKLGYSCYVAHRLVEIHKEDLEKAAKILEQTGYEFVASCARDGGAW
jgi:hypothetical protein